MHALDGIRVLDLTHVYAGPFCAYQLGVMGAEVIKVEPVDRPDMTRFGGAHEGLGDAAMGVGFLAQGSGKQAIALDLASDAGRDVFQKLVRTADVLVQNYTTHCLEKLGLLPEQLQAINPKLICCSLSAYGRTGPKANHPAYDPAIQAFTGMMASNGEAGSRPVRCGPPVVDYGTGMQAAMAVCAALFARERTGIGAAIDVAMTDSALMLMTANVVINSATGAPPKPFGNVDTSHAGCCAYETSDGTIMLVAHTPTQAANLMQALGNQQAADELRGIRQKDMPLRYDQDSAFLTRILATNTAEYWEELLNDAHVPAARVRTLDEAVEHPQIASRDMLNHLDVNGQPLTFPVAGFAMSPFEHKTPTAPRSYGADTEAVLGSLGYDDARIAEMRKNGAIA